MKGTYETDEAGVVIAPEFDATGLLPSVLINKYVRETLEDAINTNVVGISGGGEIVDAKPLDEVLVVLFATRM